MVETFSPGQETDQYGNAVRDMFRTGISSGGQNAVCNHKAQVLTKWMLLEQVSAFMKCQPWYNPPQDRVQSKEKIHSKMAPVVKAAPHWAQAFRSLKQEVALLRMAENARLHVPAAGALTSVQEANIRGLRILNGARASDRKSKYAIFEKNVQCMAFMLHWHSTVSALFHYGDATPLNARLSAQCSIPTRPQSVFPTALRRKLPLGFSGASGPDFRGPHGDGAG